jgi:hypothetical protein
MASGGKISLIVALEDLDYARASNSAQSTEKVVGSCGATVPWEEAVSRGTRAVFGNPWRC